MKRRTSPTAQAADQDNPRRRRQPQTSCNFCRSKKLKCDRGQPCANCTTRGIPCEGHTSPPPRVSGLGTNAASPETVLERLHRLEEAVFGATSPNVATQASAVTSAQPPVSRHTEGPWSESNRAEREHSAEVDYNQVAPVRDSWDFARPSSYAECATETLSRPSSQIIDDCDLFTFHVTTSGGVSSSKRSSSRCIDIPCQNDALALFREYLDNTDFHIVNLIHQPRAQTIIHELYKQLRQAGKVNLSSVAFVLSICAASAFFWDRQFPHGLDFLSEENAATCSRAWRASALDLLDQAQRAGLQSLDTIIARIILADLVYNMEGTSARFRYIQSAARAAAYEMDLHLIDLPAHENGDTTPDREMKRRVWWYLASTDWLLGAMGGPSGRIYTVNPRHMQVNYPRYIANFDPMIIMYGTWAETALLHTSMRIRLGDICRQVVDALPLGSGDIDSLPYSKIAGLDRLFEQLQLDIPTVMSRVDMSSLDATTQKLALQRSIGSLSLNARWARLLRPLLQANNLPKQFETFRKRCLNSTETVIDIASSILSAAVDSPDSSCSSSSRMPSRRSPYRSGLIINHLFMACAVLATDPALRENAGTGESTRADAGTERRRSALANACRLLEKAGEKSDMAAAMVRRLVGVLKKHRVHGVESDSRSLRTDDASASGKPAAPGQNLTQRQQQGLPMTDNSMALASQQQVIPSGWAFDMSMNDPIGVGGIWDGFFETTPTDDGWQQLFADLDSFAGGV